MLEEFLTSAQLALMHIGAAREGASIAANHRDLRLGVEVEAAQRVRQVPHQIVIEGVQLLRPVEAQSRDLVLAGVFDQAHARPSCWLRAINLRCPMYTALPLIVSPLGQGS